ncbi:MAG: Wzz/FepE/Etk N-terminal domain-containing protein [Flavipsychrobacter sp.]
MTTPYFDLVDIIRAIQKHRRFIIIVTVVAAILGALFFAVRKKKYKAEAQFLVTNPLYGDRNYLFRNRDTRFIDFFGGDDDLDKVTALAGSDTVRDRIIRNCQFQEVYKSDINDPKGHAFLMNIFNKNFNIKRTEYKDMEVSYIAYDAQTAANVANMSVKVLEEIFRSYYTNIKKSVETSIANKVTQLDSSINALTDTLAAMRDQYKIYDIISPARQNIITGDIKGGGAGYGKAIEEIQNIESVKDQYVSDRARYISELNEFAASTNSSMRFLKVITPAEAPLNPSGPGLMLTIVVAALLGLFFSVIYTVLMAYYRMLNTVER